MKPIFITSIWLLMKISPEDIQWVGEDPGIPLKGGYGRAGHGMNRGVGRDGGPGGGRGRGMTKGHIRKDFPPSQNGIGKKAPDDIQLLHTDALIKEVISSTLITTIKYVGGKKCGSGGLSKRLLGVRVKISQIV